MSLVVNHNMMAANAARNLNAHYDRLNTSTQRLSSGLRINSAADDAAGLAIRELMRADISTLQQGMRNANDAISLIQTADGALQVIDEKMTRMKELAEQASTGTYTSTQRQLIDSEYQAMASEITRIANATDFNGIKLLDGTLSNPTHDGSGVDSTGKMKIHFGTGNSSAEDYYYIAIGDCTSEAFGLGDSTNFDSTMDRVKAVFSSAINDSYGAMTNGTPDEKKAFAALQASIDELVGASSSAAGTVFDSSKTIEDQFKAYNALFDRAANHTGAGAAVDNTAGDGMRVYTSEAELKQAAFDYYRAEVGEGLGQGGSFGAGTDAHSKALENVAKMFDNAIILPEGASLKPMTESEFKALSATQRDTLKTTLAMGHLGTAVSGTRAQQSNQDISIVGTNYRNYDAMAGSSSPVASTSTAYTDVQIKSFIGNLQYGYEASKGMTKVVSGMGDMNVGKFVEGSQGIPEFPAGTTLRTPGILQSEVKLPTTSNATANDPSAIMAGTTISSGSTLASGSVLGIGTQIGAGTTISSGLPLGAGNILGKGTVFGAGTSFGTLTVLAEGTTLSNGTTLLATSILGKGTVLGEGTTMAATNILPSGTVLGGGSVLGTGTLVPLGSTLGEGTVLAATTKLGPGTEYGTGTRIGGTAAEVLTIGTVLEAGTKISDAAFVLEAGVTMEIGGISITGDGAANIGALYNTAAGHALSAGAVGTLTTSTTLTAVANIAAGGYVEMGAGSKVGTVAQTLANATTLKGTTTLRGAVGVDEMAVVGGSSFNETVLGGATTILSTETKLNATTLGGNMTLAASASLKSGTILRGPSQALGTIGAGSTLGGSMTTTGAAGATGTNLGAGTTFGGTTILAEAVTLNGATKMGGTTTLQGASILMANSRLAAGSELATGSAVPEGSDPVLNSSMFVGTSGVDELNGIYGKLKFNANTKRIERSTAPKIGSLQEATDLVFKTAGKQASETISMDGNNIRTQESAQRALAAINKAIESKDNIRAHIGALQNRLENTITNLTTQAENLQASESRISDVDVATEMTNFTRNQILTQSAVAMLGQANSMSQMAMKLIGG